jgi:hypothetical protein
MLLAAALSVLLDGVPLRSYNRPYLKNGRIMVPIEPYVTAIADTLGVENGALIVRRGDRFVQVCSAVTPVPSVYDGVYVPIGPIAQALGVDARFDLHSQTLYVNISRGAVALPTPFNPAVPRSAPAPVFTPSPAPMPPLRVTGTPLPRRTPLPVSTPSAAAWVRGGALRSSATPVRPRLPRSPSARPS